MVFAVPAIEPAAYVLTATDANGEPVQFINGSELTTQAAFQVMAETILWEGSFSVTWGTPFDALKTKFIDWVNDGTIKEGTIIRATVSGNGQGTMTSAWWNNILTGKADPERGDTIISGDMVLEYTLNATSLELITTQDGALFVGDGYTITRVTME